MAISVREELKAKKQAYVQDEITAAAAELFAGRGFRAVTIDDVAASLGYTKSVVYYYFKNKNEVLWTIFNQIDDAWAHDMDDILASGDAPDKMLKDMIRKHALNVLERTAWTAIYFREQGNLTEKQQATVDARKHAYNDKFRSVYQKGVKQGVFKTVPTPLIVGGIIGICNWTHDWYKKDGALKAEEIANYFADLFLNGCHA